MAQKRVRIKSRLPTKRDTEPPVADARREIEQIVDEFCRAHLNEEYRELCQLMVGLLARGKPSPLMKGTTLGWAAGVVYVIGQANFLGDPTQTPHLTTARLCELAGVSPATVQNRAAQIRKHVDISPMDPGWTLASRLADNPMAWLIELEGGLLDDARRYPREVQEKLVEANLIPFVHPSAR